MMSARLVFCLLLLATGAAHAENFSCPALHGTTRLSGGRVFDGPPEQKADLVPDMSKSKDGDLDSWWDVDYLYKAGRIVFLVCEYGGPQNTISVRVDKSVKRCIYKFRMKGITELACG